MSIVIHVKYIYFNFVISMIIDMNILFISMIISIDMNITKTNF